MSSKNLMYHPRKVGLQATQFQKFTNATNLVRCESQFSACIRSVNIVSVIVISWQLLKNGMIMIKKAVKASVHSTLRYHKGFAIHFQSINVWMNGYGICYASCERIYHSTRNGSNLLRIPVSAKLFPWKTLYYD